jgi:hypothetical protein
LEKKKIKEEMALELQLEKEREKRRWSLSCNWEKEEDKVEMELELQLELRARCTYCYHSWWLVNEDGERTINFGDIKIKAFTVDFKKCLFCIVLGPFWVLFGPFLHASWTRV